MRPRYQADWVRDLDERHQLEGAVAAALAEVPGARVLADRTDRFDALDFEVGTRRVRSAAIELKAKGQPYRGWGALRPNVEPRDLFIIDEVSLRRIVAAGHCTQLVVRDQPTDRWVLYGVADLLLADKVRTVRELRGRRPTIKAKVLLSFADGHQMRGTVDEMAAAVIDRIDQTHRDWGRIEPWPTPTGKVA